jgi:hypothetical protein
MDLRLDDQHLIVHLTPAEKFWSFHRDLAVPLTSILKVRTNRKPWLDLRGWRVTGINLQGKMSRGTRRHGSGYDFIYVTADDEAVEVELAPTGRYERLTLSVPDADAEVRRIAAAAGIAPG